MVRLAKPREPPRRWRRPAFGARLGCALALCALTATGAGAELRSVPLAGLRAEIAALIVQGVEGGSLPLAVTARVEDAAPAEGDRLALPVSLEVPGVALLGATRRVEPPLSRLELEIYLYAVDAEDRVVGHRAERLTIVLDEAGERLFDAGLRFRDELALPPGSYSLRFLVFESVSRAFGLAIKEVTVGAGAGNVELAAPRFTGACDDWLAAASGAGAERTAAVSGRPVLRAGEASSASVALLGAMKREPPWTVRASLEPLVVGSSEPPVAAAAVELAAAKERRLDLEITPPVDLPQGRYRLRLWLGDGEGGATGEGGGAGAASSNAVEIWLLSPEAPRTPGDCAPDWGEVYRLALGGDLASGASVVGGEIGSNRAPDREMAERGLRRRYLGLLGEFAKGQSLAEARARLGETENDFLSGRLDTFARLRAIELEAAGDLAASDRRCLPVLLALHEEAYEEHFRRGRYGLATHSRELVMRLIDELVVDSQDDDERLLAARVLTSLGERAESHQVAGAAQEMLELALDLDPANLEARLLLATSYERIGRSVLARRHLATLVAASAGHVEARVRLGVLLAREGRLDDSERILRRLLGERPGGWAATMAYQTLARVLLDGERFSEAAELLAEARTVLPNEQRLTLLGAYALDRAGRPAEAARWIAELPPAAPGGSARLRYGRPPEAAGALLGPLRDQLARSVGVRLPVLAKALGELEGGES